MHLYAIRHGQSYLNLPDWDGKDGDAPLSPHGEKQAEALAAWLPHLPEVDAIYSSTLHRAQDTAVRLGAAYGQEVHFDPRLCEIGTNRIDHNPYPDGSVPNGALSGLPNGLFRRWRRTTAAKRGCTCVSVWLPSSRR